MSNCHSNNQSHPVGEVFIASGGTEFLFRPDFTGPMQITFRGRKFAILCDDLRELVVEKMVIELLKPVKEANTADQAA